MHSHLTSLAKIFLLATLFRATALCHPEESSLANHDLAEATGSVGTHRPEATRMRGRAQSSCFCGNRYINGNCPDEDCPRIQLGQGSWHKAFPKLVELFKKGTLRDHYPQLDFAGLHSSVTQADRQWSMYTTIMDTKQQQRHPRQSLKSATASRRPEQGRAGDLLQDHHSKPREQQQAWRNPRRANAPHPSAASSSSRGQPEQIKSEPDDASTEGDEEGGGYASDLTVIDSDASQASIYGLRSALHEVEQEDELSEASSYDHDSRAVAERGRVNLWRTQNLLESDPDFAYAFNNFQSAYAHAGRAVAAAWSNARFLAEPDMDEAMLSAIEATADKIRAVDNKKNQRLINRERWTKSSLRQPGKGASPEEAEDDKNQFIEPFVELMVYCNTSRRDNSSASMRRLAISSRLKATQAVKSADFLTLYRAVITARDIMLYIDHNFTQANGVDPTMLEDFLLQSSARNRAVKAVEWMCNNLDLELPIEEMGEPAVQEASLNSTRRKRFPATQPVMLKALEDTMEAAATENSPTWLALLASWVQAMAGLQLTDVLRRSVPVELYDGWIVFFCKQSKNKHNRAGFYWGVPSTTSVGYVWTDKFLEEYRQRRGSSVGTEMMGMIFRTDNHQYLSSNAVRSITLKAISGIIEDPEQLATHSWKSMLPTTALHLGFSPAERLAVGERRDAEAMSDEAPITRGLDEAREGKSRTCKLICAEVFAMLAKSDTHTFDEIPAQRWEDLANAARRKIETRALDTIFHWRNDDVAHSGGGFKVKKSQITFPKQLNGVPLMPSNRAGEIYCVDFQSNSCRHKSSCQLGLHKCAALFKGGRTCNMNHPGMNCNHTKKHEVIESSFRGNASNSAPRIGQRRPRQTTLRANAVSDDPSAHPMEAFPSGHEGPSQKKAKRTGSTDQPQPEDDWVTMTASSKAMPRKNAQSLPKYVKNSSIMQRLLPQLRREKAVVRGNRINPEPPSLVAKVCNEDGKGKLWLGPLPTAERMQTVLEANPVIQIYCFKKDPTEVTVAVNKGRGMHIPGAVLFRCEISNPHARLVDMQILRPRVFDSLRNGHNVYIHCVSGITRAPMAAAVLCAMLMGITLEEAKHIISQSRNVSFHSGKDLNGAWIPRLLRESNNS